MANGITVLLGAGSILDISPNLSTQRLTEIILEFPYVDDLSLPEHTKRRYEAIKLIKDVDEYCQRDGKRSSFESIFQVILDIYSQKQIGTPGVSLSFEVPSFCSETSCLICEEALGFILEKVYMNISHETKMDPPEWFSEFFASLTEWCNHSIHLDCYTLNYDTLIDRSLPRFNDGYELKSKDYSVFNPRKARLTKSMVPILNHIHGSILFNYRPSEETDTNDILYKYDKPVSSVGVGNLLVTTQLRRYAMFSPIITGMDKTNSITVDPFSVYHSNFINSLIRNDVLLIIGYGFGDNYLNYLLGSYDRWGKKTTILVSPTTDEALFAEVKSKGKQMGGCHIYGNYVWFDCTFAEACKKGLMEFIKDHTSTKFRKELASALRVAYKNSWK